jgi:hypothetical protein
MITDVGMVPSRKLAIEHRWIADEPILLLNARTSKIPGGFEIHSLAGTITSPLRSNAIILRDAGND